MNHQVHREKVLEILQENKHLVEKQKEDEIVALSKRIYADKDYLDEISNRLYKDAERRIKAKEYIMNFSKDEEAKNEKSEEENLKAQRLVSKDNEKMLNSVKDRIVTDYSNKTLKTFNRNYPGDHHCKGPKKEKNRSPNVKGKALKTNNENKVRDGYDYDRLILEDEKVQLSEVIEFNRNKKNKQSFEKESNSLLKSNDRLKGASKKIISDIQAVKYMDVLFSSK